MELRGLLIIGIAFFVLFSGCVSEDYIPEKYRCEQDSDCVGGGSCCHPSECTNNEWAAEWASENCNGQFCTAVCETCPECRCVEGACMKTGKTEGCC